MKKYTITIVCCLCLFLGIVNSLAQEDKHLCERRLERIARMLSETNRVEEDFIIALENSISPCYGENALSYFVRGLLEINKKATRDYKLAYDYFKISSDLGYVKAKTYLAFCYKNGWGVAVDFKKSQTYLEDATAFNDEIALYALGYYHFKGLNSGTQNYKRAITLFEKSNHEMAKHWLAISYIFGFGSDTNNSKGIELLAANTTPNSQNLLSAVQSKQYRKPEEFKTIKFLMADYKPIDFHVKSKD